VFYEVRVFHAVGQPLSRRSAQRYDLSGAAVRVTGIAVDNRGGIGPVAPGLPALKPARRRKTCRKEAVRRESPAL